MLFIFSAALFCVLFYVVYDLYKAFLISDNAVVSTDLNVTLENLLTQNKIFSAKDFFGELINVYNNIFIVLVCIIGLSGIFGFIYIKNRTEEQMEEAFKKYMNDEAKIKKIANDVLEKHFKDELNKQSEERNDLKERVNALESSIVELEDEKNHENNQFSLEIKDDKG